MNYIILPIITFVLCGVSLVFFLKDIKKNNIDKKISGSEEAFSKLEDSRVPISRSIIIYSAIMILITIGVSVVFYIYYNDNNIFISIKRMALLSLLWPIAYIDFKSYRIPNVFIILGIVYRILLLPFELIFINKGVWITLLSEIIAAAALLLASFLCSLCIKNSIGFGDIKLFIVMGLLLGLDGIWGAIFLSLIISFFIAIFLLITKKKTRKDAIPFGPAIVLGTYLSVCLSGM